jgi:hypothetical protein
MKMANEIDDLRLQLAIAQEDKQRLRAQAQRIADELQSWKELDEKHVGFLEDVAAIVDGSSDGWRGVVDKVQGLKADRDALVKKAERLNAAVLRAMPYIVPGDPVPETEQGELHEARRAVSAEVARIKGMKMVLLASESGT